MRELGCTFCKGGKAAYKVPTHPACSYGVCEDHYHTLARILKFAMESKIFLVEKLP